MQKIASFIVKKRNFILVIVLVIAALCGFFIPLYPTARIRLGIQDFFRLVSLGTYVELH